MHWGKFSRQNSFPEDTFTSTMKLDTCKKTKRNSKARGVGWHAGTIQEAPRGSTYHFPTKMATLHKVHVANSSSPNCRLRAQFSNCPDDPMADTRVQESLGVNTYCREDPRMTGNKSGCGDRRDVARLTQQQHLRLNSAHFSMNIMGLSSGQWVYRQTPLIQSATRRNITSLLSKSRDEFGNFSQKTSSLRAHRLVTAANGRFCKPIISLVWWVASESNVDSCQTRWGLGALPKEGRGSGRGWQGGRAGQKVSTKP